MLAGVAWRLEGGVCNGEVMASLFPTPWDPSHPAILDVVQEALAQDGGLGEPPMRLPDERQRVQEFGWAPGAMDGTGARHWPAGDDAQAVEAVVAAVLAASAGGALARVRLYELVNARSALGLVDPLLERLRALGVPAERVMAPARWLVTEGRHRAAVKVGIALLGLGHTPEDRELLKVLGRHEDFTLYVAVALSNTAEGADRELFDLAKTVHGWGRIELVERLRHTRDPQIKDWIVREGFRNTVLNDYLAWIAATTGDLLARLRADPDDQLVDAACQIMAALMSGGPPVENIHDYADAPQAVLALLQILATRASKVAHVRLAATVQRFLQDPKHGPSTDVGWTEGIRHEALGLCGQIKAQPQWQAYLVGLTSADQREFEMAVYVAQALGHDVYDHRMRFLRRKPTHTGLWSVLAHTADDDRIDELLELADELLPLDELATGPTPAQGHGDPWRLHEALAFVVQALRRFPGKGWPFIHAALRSPTREARSQALWALAQWGKPHWPPEAAPAVEQAIRQEPVDRLREQLQRLLSDQPLYTQPPSR